MRASLSQAFDVAVFAPLRKSLHYLSGHFDPSLFEPGRLVRVPLGRGQRVGVILGPATSDVIEERRLKPVADVIHDLQPIDEDLLKLIRWAADYYHHPLGDAIATSLPGVLRRGCLPPLARASGWAINESAGAAPAGVLGRAPRQALILDMLRKRSPLVPADFEALDFDWRRALRELEKKGLVDKCTLATPDVAPPKPPVTLNDEQQGAVNDLVDSFGSFRVHFLYGVTGSGKTEVYLAAIRHAIEHDLSALMLVPEIALTRQMVMRLRAAFGAGIGVLHSRMSDTERAQVWLDCRKGTVKVLMGTRSAVWAPLPRIGIIVIDEEHDGSFKQQEGFRYNARDVAIKRAQALGIPIVLGSATPSLETYLNAQNDKYSCLRLSQRAGAAQLPTIRCIDVRGLPLTGGLSDSLCRAIEQRLERKEQTLLFLNRRGYAPVLLCHQCGHIANCQRCDAKLVWHKERQILICHHCGGQTRVQQLKPCCPATEFVPLGLGTEQVESALRELFPDKKVARIDRDSVRRKNSLDATLAAVRSGEIDILVGTQMLAKGHDFSRVTLVGIVDADAQLFSTDFRAEEKLAQMIIQVAGRAGRAEIPGQVLIQTHHPHHGLFQTLMGDGYERFVELALAERHRATLPPYSPMALIRAESPSQQMPLSFLAAVASCLKSQSVNGLEIYGPIPAAMEKKAGRYRAQIALIARDRRSLAASVKSLIDNANGIAGVRRVRWSIDIDPHDTL